MTHLSNDQIRELGKALIAGYQKDYGILFSRCVDIIELAEHLGLTVVFEKFAEEDQDKIGFLSDGNTPLKVWRNKRIVPVRFPIRTIVIEEYLKRESESGRCRFTIAHEIAHYVIGRYIQLPYIPKPEYHRIYDDERHDYGKELLQQLTMVENRADRLAAQLLMPEHVVSQALADFHKGEPIPMYGWWLFTPNDHHTIESMAAQLQVSFSALKIQLNELEMISRRPREEYTEAIRQEGWL